MSKHTPGPWEVMKPYQTRKGFVYCQIQTTAKGLDASPLSSVSAYLYNSRGEAYGKRDRHGNVERFVPEGEAMANARLIAAAPDLLEALEAYQHANRIHSDGEARLYEQAEAAVKKAKGE